jgi:hypothetical protein
MTRRSWRYARTVLLVILLPALAYVVAGLAVLYLFKDMG